MGMGASVNIDQWAAQADSDPRVEGESWPEYRARIVALRQLSAENARRNPWSLHRRQPRPGGPVDLYTATGEFVRHCPLGPMQALETVWRKHPAAKVRLEADQRQISIEFPSSPKQYTYSVRKGA